MTLKYIAMVHDFARFTHERYIEQDGPERGMAKYRQVPSPTYGKLVAHCSHGAVVSLYDAPYKATSPVKHSNDRLDRMLAGALATTPTQVVTAWGDETDADLIRSWPRACVKYFDTDDLATWGADQDTAAQEHESASVRRAEKAIKAMRGEVVDAPVKKKRTSARRKRRAVGTVLAQEVTLPGGQVARDGQTYDLVTSVRLVTVVADGMTSVGGAAWLHTDGRVMFGRLGWMDQSRVSRLGTVVSMAYDGGQRTATIHLDQGVAPSSIPGGRA